MGSSIKLDKKIRVLSIGQLPKEVRGHYTTGVARVVYELSKQKWDKVSTFLYATNIDNDNAQKLSNYQYQYMGYKIAPFGLLLDWVKHPIKTIKRFKHYKNKSHNNPIRFDFMRYNMAKAIRSVQPDLIHMHGDGLDSLYFANEELGVPIILTLHGVFWDGDEADIVTKDRYFNNVPFANYFTGLNQECKRRMLQLGIPEDKLTLIPNGVDTEKFYFSEDARIALRSEYQVPDNRLVFITVGSVIERKGQLPSIKILESLGIDFEYWIIGSGNEVEKIKSYVDLHNLREKVKLIGYVNDVDLYKYLSAADIYVHGSDMEGQALSETEAYATGLRVIVNNKISKTVVGDAQNDKQTYYVLDYANPDMKELKKWIFSHYDRKSKSKYSWSNIAEQYAEVYSSMMANKEKLKN